MRKSATLASVQYIPDSRIERELTKLVQLTVPYNLRKHFPYADLGNRRMELLLYTLFRRGLASGWFKKEYDEVYLTTTVPGLGRMLLLQYRGAVKGAVLLKAQAEPMSVPELARSILGFLLQSIAGQVLSFKPEGFQILLVVPGNVLEETQQLVVDINRLILTEPMLPFWIQELLDTQPGLQEVSFDSAEGQLYEYLQKVDLELILAGHLDQRLAEQPDIKSLFFGVEMVSTEQNLRKILGEFRLANIRTEELDKWTNQMSKSDEDRRLSFGLLRFFGYPRDFLQALSKDPKLREVLVKGAEFKAELDYAVLDFLHGKTILISQVLLAEAPGQSGDPARQAIVPYLFSKIAIKYIKNNNSSVLREIASSGARPDFYEDASLDLIKSDLLNEAEALAEDENKLPAAGNPRELLRLEQLRKAALERPDIEDLARQFDEDWAQLQPVVKSIEKKLIELLPKEPLVLLEDFASLDQESRLDQLFSQFRARFKGEDRQNT
jgi:hypothetical protein